MPNTLLAHNGKALVQVYCTRVGRCHILLATGPMKKVEFELTYTQALRVQDRLCDLAEDRPDLAITLEWC